MDNKRKSNIRVYLLDQANKVSNRACVAAFLFGLVAYVLFFKSINHIAGDGAFALMSLFPILAGSLLGVRYGIFFGIFASVTGFSLGLTVGYSFQEALRIITMVIFINIFLGFTVGRLRELNIRVKKELSERILAEEEKKKLEKSLIRAKKMEAIGLLAGGVAHDLNNVLAGSINYTELMLMNTPEDHPFREYILKIQKSGEKCAAMVSDLLDLARREHNKSEVVSLNDVINEYLKSPEFEMLKLYHPNVRVISKLDSSLLNTMGSQLNLSKIVMNLVSNAAEALPEGGEVLISTENQYLAHAIKGHEVVKEGDYINFTVYDNGIGISPQDIEKIFEPFFTKKKMGRSGTGLGMAVVWGTVKDHNGYIDVHSLEGEGTTFNIYLPATRNQLAKKIISLPVENYSGNGESILVVDDIEEQREIAMTILKDLGYEVTEVSSGEKAIEYVEDNSVDLLVLNLLMDPGMNGIETYKQILKFHPQQKAVFVSGFLERSHVEEALTIGTEQFVKKPYTIRKIAKAVKAELGVCKNGNARTH